MAALRLGSARPAMGNPLSAWVPLVRRNIWSPPNIPRIPAPPSPTQQRTFHSSHSPFARTFFGPARRGSNFNNSQYRKFTTTFQPANQNQLAHTERTANNNPTSATAQAAFYSALLRANMPKIIIERYQTGRYASNAAADAAYLKALQMTGSVPAPGNNGSGNVGQPGAVSQDTLQAVGQAVAAQSYGGQVGSVTGKNTTGTGAKDAPLYVVVEESMGAMIFRWAKMLIYAGLIGYFLLVVLTMVVELTGSLRTRVGQNNEVCRSPRRRRRAVPFCLCENRAALSSIAKARPRPGHRG